MLSWLRHISGKEARVRRALLLTALLVPLSAAGGLAQSGPSATGGQLSRAELQEQIKRYDDQAASDVYSSTVREQARRQAALFRRRLEEGDFRVGDRIHLIVEGHQALSDTFNVIAGRRIILPVLEDVALTGVLRSELQSHLAAHVARFIRNATVHTQSLMRLEIRGAVGRPGFYTLPSDVVLSDALMMAGGLSSEAGLDDMRVERGDETIWDGDQLREAVVSGSTLDQLSMQTGDAIYIPVHRSRFELVRNTLTVLSTLAAVVMIILR
jgi:protein involved in polysaccharide export with SLBB domain